MALPWPAFCILHSPFCLPVLASLARFLVCPRRACCSNRPVAGRGVLTAPRSSADVRKAPALAPPNGALRIPRPISKPEDDLGKTPQRHTRSFHPQSSIRSPLWLRRSRPVPVASAQEFQRKCLRPHARPLQCPTFGASSCRWTRQARGSGAFRTVGLKQHTRSLPNRSGIKQFRLPQGRGLPWKPRFPGGTDLQSRSIFFRRSYRQHKTIKYSTSGAMASLILTVWQHGAR
jgi:hypothetical protein